MRGYLQHHWRYLMTNKARGQRRRMAKAYLCHRVDMHMMYKQVLEEQEELADRISVNIN
jgi:hypothetical protein